MYTLRLFRRCVRVSHELFDWLLRELFPESEPGKSQHGGRKQKSNGEKLAVFLKYVGSHDTILDIAKLFKIAEFSVIKARQEVTSRVMQHLLSRILKWPSDNDDIAKEFTAN